MTDSESTYNFVCIRELLTNTFTADTLRRFCHDRPLFRPILANLGPDYTLSQIVDEVMDYCRTRNLWDQLLDEVEKQNRPSREAREPSPPIPPEPRPKGSLPRAVVWVAIAALILVLVVIHWLCLHNPEPPVVALKTTHNRYVGVMGAHDGWKLKALSDMIGECDGRFALLCQDDGTVVLQTCHKNEDGNPRYVTPLGEDRDWELKGETDAIGEWEEFTFLDADTGERRSCSEVLKSLKDGDEVRVAFQTWHPKDGKHRLVTAMDADWDWVLRAETTELREAERFTIILLP